MYTQRRMRKRMMMTRRTNSRVGSSLVLDSLRKKLMKSSTKMKRSISRRRGTNRRTNTRRKQVVIKTGDLQRTL